MAEHAQNPHLAPNGMDAHKATYKGFLDFSVAGSIICIYVVVALVGFRFLSNPLNLLFGFGSILLGTLTSLIALRMGGKWAVALVPLVLCALFAAANVQMS
jgi:predicted membrane protein